MLSFLFIYFGTAVVQNHNFVHRDVKILNIITCYIHYLFCFHCECTQIKADLYSVISGPKCAKKISPTPLHHHHQPEPSRQGRMDPCVLYAKFWPYHLNVAAEIETHQTRQRFSNLLLSDFGEPLRIVAAVSCSWLTGAAPGVVFCCCSLSASRFYVLCIQWWYSAYFGCNEWLFELLLPFYHL